MVNIKYIRGDATNPQGDKPKIIIHVCNDIGAWGKGFVLALSKKWKEPENQYREWAENSKNAFFGLGQIQFIKVEENLYVANMIGQHGIKPIGDVPPVRYDRIRQCLIKVATRAKSLNADVHAPRFGSGLAGGHWKTIEGLIEETLIANGIDVTIYDL